jgi:acetyltransferase-like isoleucine patch superfamily enzyme
VTWARLQLRRCARVGPRVAVTGRVWVHGKGEVSLEEGVALDAAAAPIELHALRGGEIAIGAGARIEAGASIEAVPSVRIGRGARIGRFVKVLDNDFHSATGDRHRAPPSDPVTIGDGATVGDRAILLPGTRVPDGAVVAPGAVLRGRRGAGQPGPSGPVARFDPVSPLAKVLAWLRARLALRACRLGPRVYAFGPVRAASQGELRLGQRVGFMAGVIATELRCHPGALLEIGDDSIVAAGAAVEAHRSVRIGRRCLLATAVRIDDAGDGAPRPIHIGDDVWIAHGATVSAGVRIGDGSVVAAGSQVLRDVPAGMLAIGRPARCIGLDLLAGASGGR